MQVPRGHAGCVILMNDACICASACRGQSGINKSATRQQSRSRSRPMSPYTSRHRVIAIALLRTRPALE
eukprot:scaffold2376_cov115-Isochrysis_galbana.AAC.4